MPARPAADVQHTSQTDHRVLKNPASMPFKDQASSGHDQYQLVDDGGNVPEWEIARARAILMSRRATEVKSPALATLATESLEALSSRGLKDSIAEHALGEAYLLQNRLEVAETRWRNALQLNSDNYGALRSLAIAVHSAGRDAEAEPLLAEILRHNRRDRVILGRYVHVLGRLNQQSKAATTAEEAVRKYPYDFLIRQWLYGYYNATQRDQDAAIHKEVAERVSPRR